MKKFDLVEILTEEIKKNKEKFELSDNNLTIFMSIVDKINFVKKYETKSAAMLAMICRILREVDITVEQGIEFCEEFISQYSINVKPRHIDKLTNCDTEALYCQAFAENKIKMIKKKI
jgi:hypothetical protein